MNIFKYAIQMEKDAEGYYRELAEKCVIPGFKNVLNKMAEEKVKHYEFLDKLNSKTKFPEMVQTDILTDMKNVYSQLKEEKKPFEVPHTELEIYNKALELEKEAQKFYLKESESTDEHPQKELFHKLSVDHGKYARALESITDFVAQPERWLEDSEWYHLDDY